MRLSVYLKKKKIAPEDFARAIGAHPSTVYRFLHGLSFPKSGNIRKIFEATEGAVKANDFIYVERPAYRGIGRPRSLKVKDLERKAAADGAN